MGSDLLVAILAAGASRRLGQPKQLIDIGGEALLRRQCRVALESGLGPVVVICGSDSELCMAQTVDLPVTCRHNARWEEGMASSLGEAVGAAMSIRAAAILVMLVDQYRLAPADLRTLAAAWVEAGSPMACRARDGDYVGPPVILSAELFGPLMQLHGDQGARVVLAGLDSSQMAQAVIPNAADDLDSPEQVAAMKSWLGVR